jgi:cytoskeletal protein CcmA (bactofilin family)
VQGVNQSGGVAGDFQGNVNVNGGMTVTGRMNVLGETSMGILAHGPVKVPNAK